MAATYDPTATIGKIRLLIHDTDVDPASDATFTDAEIEAFYSMGGSSIFRAASLALRNIATNQALTEEMARSLTWTTDNRGAAAKILAMADRFDILEETIPAAAIAEWGVTDPTRWEIESNYAMETGG